MGWDDRPGASGTSTQNDVAALAPSSKMTESDVARTGEVRRDRRLDGFDWGVLAVLSVLSVWVMVGFIVHQGPTAIWTGTDGPYVADQMNYLGWIAVSAMHGFISDPFTIGSSPSDYLHPGIFLSGLLVRAGMTPGWAYLVWSPVAILVLFAGSRRYVRASLSGLWGRRTALVLCLFYVSPAWVMATWAHLTHWAPISLLQSIDTEIWPVIYLWGYPFTAIAVGLLVFALVAYERDRRVGRVGAAAPILGFMCAWLQPWQAATLIGVVVLTELILRLRGERGHLALPVVLVASTTVPLVYYEVLSHVDWTWAVADRANLNLPPYLPWQAILLSLAPLGILAAFACRPAEITFHQLALRLWPLIGLAQYAAIYFGHVGTFPLHSLDGLGIPLAVLAVTGARRLSVGFTRRTKVVVASVVLVVLIVPSAVQELHGVWGVESIGILGTQPALITPDELDALRYLKNDPTPGGVLTPFYLGQTVPAETNRQTWLGALSWTPNFFTRLGAAGRLFSGGLPPEGAVRFVSSSGARFLLSDCGSHTDLSVALAPILRSVHHFGCATVYEVEPGG